MSRFARCFEICNFSCACEIRRFYKIRNFNGFCKNRSSCRGPLNPLFYRFSLTWRIFQFFADFTIFAIFAKIAVLVGALSTSFSTGFHWVDEFSIFYRFYNIHNFRSFRKNCSSCRGPLNLLFYWFSLTRRVFQFFANFAIFAAACKPGHISVSDVDVFLISWRRILADSPLLPSAMARERLASSLATISSESIHPWFLKPYDLW